MPLEFEKPIVELENKIKELEKLNKDGAVVSFSSEIKHLKEKLKETIKKVYENLDEWQTVQVARHPQRPIFPDYIKLIFSNFIELHGDRLFADDRAIIGGFATIANHKVMIIGHQKGKTLEENKERNFGMARPEGYRKALRLMKLAEKFGLPVITFIDTPGAYPGIDAEERGQAEAIARNLFEMAGLRIPTISVVIGEGGSGGALAIGVTDRILMLKYAIYSVISPEGCASILWRDAKYASTAAKALKLTAKHLYNLKVIDEIVEEPPGGAHRFPEETAQNVKEAILRHLVSLKKIKPQDLVKLRLKKYAQLKHWATA